MNWRISNKPPSSAPTKVAASSSENTKDFNSVYITKIATDRYTRMISPKETLLKTWEDTKASLSWTENKDGIFFKYKVPAKEGEKSKEFKHLEKMDETTKKHFINFLNKYPGLAPNIFMENEADISSALGHNLTLDFSAPDGSRLILKPGSLSKMYISA